MQPGSHRHRLALALAVLTACGSPSPEPSADTHHAITGTRLLAPAGEPAPGRTLMADLGCGVCHAGGGPVEAARRAAPRLDGTGDRYEPGWIFAYLLDPTRRRSDLGASRMPRFHLDDGEALALTLYLASRSGPAREEAESAPAPDPAVTRRGEAALRAARERFPEVGAGDGAAIYAALGCDGCHGAETMMPIGPPLAGVSRRLRPGWVRAYLLHPGAVRPLGFRPGSGSRMPDFGLSPAEVDSILGVLFAGEPPAKPIAEPSAFQVRKAEALLRDRLDCLGCHRLGGDGGRIGPPLDGVAVRVTPAHLNAMLTHPGEAVPGSAMPRPFLSETDRRLLVSYLATRTDTAVPEGYPSLVRVPPLPATGSPERSPGSDLYARHCAVCHGPSGQGDGPNADRLPVRPAVHADSAAMSARPDDVLFDGIHAGAAILGGSPRMPAFGATLTADEIRALVGHIRDLCGCQGPAWSRDGKGGSS